MSEENRRKALAEDRKKPFWQRTLEHNARMQERRASLRAELELLMKGQDKIVWEVGCGHGHFLTGYADKWPERFCIGVDIIEDRIVRGLRKRDRAELDNLHFVRSEAQLFLDEMPEGVRFESVFILFPDPWPKTRHHKNRVMQAAFLAQVAKRCLPGATLHFRTDYEPYFEATIEMVQQHPDWKLTTEKAWPFELETVFQQRAASFQSMIAERR